MSDQRCAHYRPFLDSSPWPSWIVDPGTGAILGAGEEAARCYGYSRQEFTGMRLRDLVPPDEAEGFRLSGHDAKTAGRWKHLRKDGSALWVELFSREIACPDGSACLVIAHDISALMESEDASRRSEARFRSLIENATDVITVLDATGVIIYESPSAGRSLGYQPEEMLGRRAIDFIHPDDVPATQAALARAMADPSGTHVLEYRIRHGDGTWRVREGSGRNLLHDPNVRGFVINSRDITERKQAEEALRAAEERRRFAMEAAGVGVWDWDVLEDTISWSKEMYLLHGLSAEGPPAVSFDSYFDLVHPQDREALIAAIQEVLRRGTNYRREFRVVWPDGSVHWLAGRARVFKDESGRAVRMTGIAMDISEQKAAEQERMELLQRERRAREEAERASRAKTNFLAVVSHELRTPLASIISFSELLQEEMAGPLTDHQKQHVQRISDSAWHLTDLVGEILEFSRGETGPEELRIQREDASALVQQVVQETAAQAAARNLSLRFAGPGEEVPVETDRLKLRQILLNLVSNAIKFTHAGEVRVELEHDDRELVLRVVDTGPGISEHDQAQIFDAFWQAESPMTRRSGGTGLGLSIARQLARLLGGELTVSSELGAGSTFTLRVPRRAPRPTPEEGADHAGD